MSQAPQTLEDLEKELKRSLYKESYYTFFVDAFKVLNPTDDYSDNWHIKYLCDELQKIAENIRDKKENPLDVIINVPFRSAKSLLCTVIFPVWTWLIKEDMKFICTSYGADLALEHAQLSRNLIESEWFCSLFAIQMKKDENSKSFYVNTKGGFRKSVGMGGAITGSGGDIIIVDDPLNPKKAASDAERTNANNYYSQTLYSRLNQPRTGVRIIIMQRLHQEDLSGYLLSTRPEDHKHICIPAEISKHLQPKSLAKYYKDGLFWPDRFGVAQLNAYNKALGSYGYSGQLQQTPTPKGGGIIKESWFNIVEGSTVARNPNDHPVFFYLDTSYTEKHDNDPNAFIACFKKNDDLYIMNVQEQWLEFPDLINYTSSYANRYGYSSRSMVKVEPKASGKSLVQSLKRSSALNVIEGDNPKDDKVTRLTSISPMVEAGRIYLIKGDWNEAFISQVANQPNSKRWDMTDVFVMAVEDQLAGSNFDFLL